MIIPELFAGLPLLACEEILSRAHRKTVGCLKNVFWQGDPIRDIFLLIDGMVKITQISHDGHEIILRLHVPGQVIGPPVPPLRRTYASSAQTLRRCHTLFWSIPEFERLISSFPQIYDNAEKILEYQTTELRHRLCEITNDKVPQRLAYGLLRLRHQIGREVNGRFVLNITQETLGQMTGMEVATTNRQLSKWEKLGLVTCVRNVIGIQDLLALSAIANNQLAPLSDETPNGSLNSAQQPVSLEAGNGGREKQLLQLNPTEHTPDPAGHESKIVKTA